MRRQISLLLVLVAASAATTSSLGEMRMTPDEIVNGGSETQIGSSKLPGVHTQILFGDPAKRGFYSILLFVPPRTTIQAHTHRDDRMAVVVKGDWSLGYGTHFDGRMLKTLPAGSVYSEPGGLNHFARSGEAPVVVEISGYGPTDTHYLNPADAPGFGRKP